MFVVLFVFSGAAGALLYGQSNVGESAGSVSEAGKDFQPPAPILGSDEIFVQDSSGNRSKLASVSGPASNVIVTNVWPQILLRNEIVLNDGEEIFGTHGFLVRLPGDQVFGVVARDLLGPLDFQESYNSSPGLFSESVASWKMYPSKDNSQTIPFFGFYENYENIHPETADYRDYLLVRFVGELIDIPSIPLEIAVTGPEIDQDVFVLGPADSEVSLFQNVYRATVTAYDKDKAMLVVTVELPLSVNEMKSMPVLTADGELLGIVSGHRPRPIGKVKANTVQLLAHFAGPIAHSVEEKIEPTGYSLTADNVQ